MQLHSQLVIALRFLMVLVLTPHDAKKDRPISVQNKKEPCYTNLSQRALLQDQYRPRYLQGVFVSGRRKTRRHWRVHETLIESLAISAHCLL